MSNYRLNSKHVSRGILGVWLALAVVLFWSNHTLGQDSKPAEQAFKNIQVLKGLPSSQLLTEMHLMRAALGVRCDHCHIAENSKYWMDDKPAKQTARRMIQMVFDINKANFGGRPVVTCNSCHRGQTKPLAVPPVTQGAFANTTRAELGAPAAEPLPTADDVMTRYVQAIGGRAALEGIKTRVMKVTLVRPKLVNPSGQPTLIEVYEMAPDKYMAVINSPDGTVTQGYSGAAGWIKSEDGVRQFTAGELARLKRLWDLRKDLNLKEQYTKINVTGREKIGEREAYVLEGVAADNRNEKLYFDTQSGLLLRRIVYTETLLGPDPEQTDFENYQAVDGIKMPQTIRISYLDNNHYGTTRTFTEIKNNVPVDATKFNMPPASK
jgi:hypothetical protein